MGADGDKMYLIGSSDCDKMGLTYTSDKSKAQEFTFIPSVEEGVFFIESDKREKCSRKYVSIKKCSGDSKIDFWSAKNGNQKWKVEKIGENQFAL